MRPRAGIVCKKEVRIFGTVAPHSSNVLQYHKTGTSVSWNAKLNDLFKFDNLRVNQLPQLGPSKFKSCSTVFNELWKSRSFGPLPPISVSRRDARVLLLLHQVSKELALRSSFRNLPNATLSLYKNIFPLAQMVAPLLKCNILPHGILGVLPDAAYIVPVKEIRSLIWCIRHMLSMLSLLQNGASSDQVSTSAMCSKRLKNYMCHRYESYERCGITVMWPNSLDIADATQHCSTNQNGISAATYRTLCNNVTNNEYYCLYEKDAQPDCVRFEYQSYISVIIKNLLRRISQSLDSFSRSDAQDIVGVVLYSQQYGYQYTRNDVKHVQTICNSIMNILPAHRTDSPTSSRAPILALLNYLKNPFIRSELSLSRSSLRLLIDNLQSRTVAKEGRLPLCPMVKVDISLNGDDSALILHNSPIRCSKFQDEEILDQRIPEVPVLLVESTALILKLKLSRNTDTSVNLAPHTSESTFVPATLSTRHVAQMLRCFDSVAPANNTPLDTFLNSLKKVLYEELMLRMQRLGISSIAKRMSNVLYSRHFLTRFSMEERTRLVLKMAHLCDFTRLCNLLTVLVSSSSVDHLGKSADKSELLNLAVTSIGILMTGKTRVLTKTEFSRLVRTLKDLRHAGLLLNVPRALYADLKRQGSTVLDMDPLTAHDCLNEIVKLDFYENAELSLLVYQYLEKMCETFSFEEQVSWLRFHKNGLGLLNDPRCRNLLSCHTCLLLKRATRQLLSSEQFVSQLTFSLHDDSTKKTSDDRGTVPSPCLRQRGAADVCTPDKVIAMIELTNSSLHRTKWNLTCQSYKSLSIASLPLLCHYIQNKMLDVAMAVRVICSSRRSESMRITRVMLEFIQREINFCSNRQLIKTLKAFLLQNAVEEAVWVFRQIGLRAKNQSISSKNYRRILKLLTDYLIQLNGVEDICNTHIADLLRLTPNVFGSFECRKFWKCDDQIRCFLLAPYVELPIDDLFELFYRTAEYLKVKITLQNSSCSGTEVPEHPIAKYRNSVVLLQFLETAVQLNIDETLELRKILSLLQHSLESLPNLQLLRLCKIATTLDMKKPKFVRKLSNEFTRRIASYKIPFKLLSRYASPLAMMGISVDCERKKIGSPMLRDVSSKLIKSRHEPLEKMKKEFDHGPNRKIARYPVKSEDAASYSFQKLIRAY